MPLMKHLSKKLDSKKADMTNCTVSFSRAGHITAALFLEKFVEKDIEWIHLDIAGSATTYDGEATGAPVKLLTYFLNQISQDNE
jgi:leucyl aminopeptidase